MPLDRDPDALYNVDGERVSIASNVGGWRVYRAHRRGRTFALGRVVDHPEERGPLHIELGEEQPSWLVAAGCGPGWYALVPVDTKCNKVDGELALLEVRASDVPEEPAPSAPVAVQSNAMEEALRATVNNLGTLLKDALEAQVKINAQLTTALENVTGAFAQQLRPFERTTEIVSATVKEGAVAAVGDGDDEVEKGAKLVANIKGLVEAAVPIVVTVDGFMQRRAAAKAAEKAAADAAAAAAKAAAAAASTPAPNGAPQGQTA